MILQVGDRLDDNYGNSTVLHLLVLADEVK